MKFLKKRYAYASILGLLLTGSFSYSMLKTFVLAETISTVATTNTSSNTAQATQAAKTATVTDSSYKDEKGTIYQFTLPTTYCIYENIKKDDFRFGSRLFNFNSCSLLKSCAFYIIVGNFQGQFFHLKTTV